MMGRQDRDQRQLFYEFSLDEMIPTDHLLRRINVFATAAPADLHEQLRAFYSDIGRPSVDPELMIRMLLVGYCYGIRHEPRLCQEVALHLAYRWFCKLDLDDKIPHHSTFSVNRLGRFRESEILRHIFERGYTVYGRGPCQGRGIRSGCERDGVDTVRIVTLALIDLAKATPCAIALCDSREPSVGIRIYLYMELSPFLVRCRHARLPRARPSVF
jgi:transposase